MDHTDVEVWPVSDLIPYSNNPKEHPDEQVQKIASSIKNYGWDQPIVVDGEGEIIKGHGRRQAAQVLGLDEVPVIVRDDLTDAEARAARIADNRTAESSWELDPLGAEIEQLAETPELDIDTLGFDDHELDMFLESNDEDMDLPDDDVEKTEKNDESNTSDESTSVTEDVNDPRKEWEWAGMPPYENKSQTFNHSVKVRFEDEEALDSLSELLGITLTPKTKSFYWPLTDTDRGEIEYQMRGEA